MAQYDIYRLGKEGGLFIDLQSNFVDGLPTRVGTALILREPFHRPVPRLHPQLEIDGVAYIMMTPYLVSVPAADLRQPIANVSRRHAEITSALDLLLHGF